MTEPVNVIAPMAAPSDNSKRLTGLIAPPDVMPKLSGLKKCGHSDQYGGEADQGVKSCHKLRHVCHRDFARNNRADHAADNKPAGNQNN